MIIFRRIGVFVSVLLFWACLVVFAFIVGLHSSFSTSQPLKTALQSSGVYEELTPAILASQTTISKLPLSDVGVRTALEKALSKEVYQSSSEQIIDATYNWMHGGTAEPEFSIDITPVKNTFANNISAYVHQRLDTLPHCDRAIAPPASIEEALSLVCMPPYLTPAVIANTARRDILASDLLFKGDTITAATLKDAQGRTFTQQLAFLPELYRIYVPTLVILPIAIALLALAVIFWSITRKTGLRRIAWTLLCFGLTGIVLAAVGAELLHMGVRLFGLPLSMPLELQDKLLGVIETLAAGARPWWLGVNAGYALLGTILFIILRLRRPRQTLRFSDSSDPQYKEAV